MSSRTPLVSIVIPTFNAAAWIAETLTSATSQGEDSEIIVVDDGSTDTTREVVRACLPAGGTLIATPNRGVSAARATGTRLARGRYIKYLDSDDLLTPGCMDRHCAVAEGTGCDAVYGNWQKLEKIAAAWQPTLKIERRWQDVHRDDPEIAFFEAMWAPTGAYLWRRSFLLDRHPGWHIGLGVTQDARFALDAARVGASFEHVTSVDVLYRVHSTGSVSTRSRAAFLRDCQRNALEVEGHWTRRGPLPAERLQALLRVWSHITRSAFHTDRTLFREAWEHLQGLNPGYVPSGGPWFREMATLTGYPTAERLSSWVRSLRGSR